MATELIYGAHAVRALLERHPARVLAVQLADRDTGERLRAIAALAARHGVAVERLDAGALRQRFGDVVHQGVAARIVPLAPWREDALLEAVAATRDPLVLALDGVQDPHNLGACLRSADACGVLAVVVPRDRAVQLTPAARKVAAGAAETTPVAVVTNLARTLRLLKDAGLWVVGADAEAPLPASRVDLTGGRVLVLGAEGAGLRQLTRQTCDHRVSLPQLGAVESLNVSVAAGMLLYEAVRQRQGG